MSTLASQRTWQLSDAPFNPFKLSHTETIYSIGNGYMGLRGTFEEGFKGELVSTLTHGIYDHLAGELVPDIVNLPNPFPFLIDIETETFNLASGKIVGFKRTLDMQTATLTREVLWRNSKGTIVKLRFERFASLADEHLLAQRIQITPLSNGCNLSVHSFLDGTQTNEGSNHWGSLTASVESATRYALIGTTGQSGYTVSMIQALTTDPEIDLTTVQSEAQPGSQAEFTLEKGQTVTFTKYTALHTSREGDDHAEAAHMTLDNALIQGWDTLHAAHCTEWADYWHGSDIEIDGDEVAQRALRFTTYHVLIATPRHDEHVSIGAKTLSGPGYKGHVFWDTELFMVPLLTLTQPQLARNLLMYRYHNLAGARNKARKAGYEGAMFPWESTDTGEETTPQWTNPLPDGSRIRIWTGDSEQHISTDIAYAVLQFWGWTGDDEWFARYGAEIVLDTAVFWGSRVEWNAEQDRYELSMQIGPDEYHENVNNSAFTNTMARWHLQKALMVVGWVRGLHTPESDALLTKLDISTERLTQWNHIIEKMYIPCDPRTGLIEQFDGFHKLDPMPLADWQPRVMNMDSLLGHEAAQHTMVIKQADIVMLMALLGDEFGSIEDRLVNWQYYFPLVDHGSSLSPSTHAWLAARLDLMETAYEMFIYAADIDLEDLKGNVRDGIHAAASGGLWEAAIFGFAGLSLDSAGQFQTAPNLPTHWKQVKFRFWYHGQQHTVTMEN